MRLICESCNHGYAPQSTSCPWCGASATLAHSSDEWRAVDTECYPDYWSCHEFLLTPDHPLDIDGLRAFLSRYTIVTFNGQDYDLPMIELALQGADNSTLKQYSDHLILSGEKVFHRLDWIDHIDMFNVAPGTGSLKIYGGKMHTRKMQDLPYSPDTLIDWPKRVMLREYRRNDEHITGELFQTFQTQIKLREEMSAEYGVDLRSKSDAQIAETVMKTLLPFKVQRPHIPAGTPFHYRVPDWLRFTTPKMQLVLHRIVSSPFYITESGGVAPSHNQTLIDWSDQQLRIDAHGQWVRRPKGWTHEIVRIGESGYAVGTGGLHSTESKVARRADADYEITDHDVASYYPSLILRTGIFPPQIGEVFQTIYRTWYDRRLEAKRAGNKKTANSLKTLLNGTFGKLGSKWSIFYAPSEMIQVTLTGQLALLMLIEMLELSGIGVVSANTDGIVLRTRRDMAWLRDQIITWWESVTKFETERADYTLLASRDVNSYVALKPDGEVKLKGAFAPPEPGASGWPNPSGQICVDAVVAYLRDGMPIADTIRSCQDVRRFVYIESVTGGAVFNPDGALPKKATIAAMALACEVAPDFHKAWGRDTLEHMYDEHRQAMVSRAEYLGKAVRWYYAAGSKGCITRAGSGNRVGRTDGCRPLMELPDTMPSDVDYDWYIAESRSLMTDIGIF